MIRGTINSKIRQRQRSKPDGTEEARNSTRMKAKCPNRLQSRPGESPGLGSPGTRSPMKHHARASRWKESASDLHTNNNTEKQTDTNKKGPRKLKGETAIKRTYKRPESKDEEKTRKDKFLRTEWPAIKIERAWREHAPSWRQETITSRHTIKKRGKTGAYRQDRKGRA